MRHNFLEAVLAVAGGVTLGTGAMFLMDPQQGSRRRRTIASTACEAVGGTRDAIGATLHAASDSARSAVGGVAGMVGQYANHLAEHAGKVAGAVHSTRDQLIDSARERAGRMMHSEDSHPYAMATGITIGTVGALALGAGIMFFMDPRGAALDGQWCATKCSAPPAAAANVLVDMGVI